jgi:phage terminase small subunit
MAGKKNVLKTMQDLTAKQRKFVDIYVANFGNISKTEAARQAGYVAKDPSTIASYLKLKLLDKQAMLLKIQALLHLR